MNTFMELDLEYSKRKHNDLVLTVTVVQFES